MGSLLHGVCYPTVELAKSVFCSHVHIVKYSEAEPTTEMFCSGTNAPQGSEFWIRSVFQNGNWLSDSVGTYPGFESCSFDGGTGLMVEYFGALLAFLSVVYVATKLKRYFWNDKEGL